MKNSTLTRRATLAISAGAVSLAFALPAQADLMEKIMEGMNVAFYNFKPYAFVDDNNDLVGTDIELLSAVLEQMGGQIGEAQAVDWGALIPGVNSGRFDVVAAGMFVTPKRCAAVRFSQPYFGIKQALAVPNGNPDGLSNYESVRDKGLTIGVISGAAQFGYATAAGVPEENIMQLPDNPAGIAALRAGRIDAWAVSAPGVREIVKGVPEGDIESGPVFAEVAGQPAVSHGAFAFRQADSAFVDEFDKVLTAFVGSAEHVAIMEKYGMSADELPVAKTEDLCGG
ncbi:MAG: ectoine/hydroxyectoine ABC transporter substrate-binding protein EhuB [Albidovulum sp.]|nr:ectoine/hydroxyectoine ABC transporter substrate-binding protein EhuB [Albidovulum sp.]MDE0534170.1 ectoine/hydroxyectoine ABC transporter substrate-binding protein EhuB [Albidovulum sp.]